MSINISSWLNKEIIPRRMEAGASLFARKVHRILGVLFLLVLCSFAVWRIWLHWDVNRRLARIHAAGLPINGEELNAWRERVPNTENGALVMTQAFRLLCTFPDKRSNEVTRFRLLLTRTNHWPSATKQLVKAYVQTNVPAMAKAREALQLSRFCYPIDFRTGFETKLPHDDSLREMAHIIELQAALNADAGHADEWPKQVEFLLKLANTVEGEPTLFSYSIRNAIINMAVGITERSLNQTTLQEEMCDELQREFTHIAQTNFLPRALAGERALMIPVFPRGLIGFLERDLDFYLDRMETMMSLAALPSPACLTMTNVLNAAFETGSNRFLTLSGLALSSLQGTVLSGAYMQTHTRLATTALAVERFRQKQGQLPKNLKELVPRFLREVPTDPFDGKPLRYRRLASGYVVYSVGADGHDDGGRERPERKKFYDNSTYDITFIVER
jgi:hypothetical protein